MLRTSLEKIDTKITNLFSLLFLFSFVINYYIFPSFFLLELFCSIILILGLSRNSKFNIADIYPQIILAVFSSLLILYGYLLAYFDTDGFAKETYRFFFISILFLSFYFINPSYPKLIKLIVILSRFYILYNFYEFVYINLLEIGGIKNLLFGKAIVGYYADQENSLYFLPQADLGLMFIRPFGLWMQPQKSAFIFPLAILGQYIYKKYFNNSSKSFVWYFLFMFSLILTGAKTALLTAFLTISIVHFDFLKHRINYKQMILLTIYFFLFVIVVLSSFIFSTTNQGTSDALDIDINAFLHLPLFNILFGLGFVTNETLLNLGFVGESFLVRIMSQVGIILTVVYFILFLKVSFKKINSVSISIIVIFFNMMIHYAVTTIFYFSYVLVVLIHFNNKENG